MLASVILAGSASLLYVRFRRSKGKVDLQEQREEQTKLHAMHTFSSMDHDTSANHTSDRGPSIRLSTDSGLSSRPLTDGASPTNQFTEYGIPSNELTEYGSPSNQLTEHGIPSNELREYESPSNQLTDYETTTNQVTNLSTPAHHSADGRNQPNSPISTSHCKQPTDPKINAGRKRRKSSDLFSPRLLLHSAVHVEDFTEDIEPTNNSPLTVPSSPISALRKFDHNVDISRKMSSRTQVSYDEFGSPDLGEEGNIYDAPLTTEPKIGKHIWGSPDLRRDWPAANASPVLEGLKSVQLNDDADAQQDGFDMFECKPTTSKTSELDVCYTNSVEFDEPESADRRPAGLCVLRSEDGYADLGQFQAKIHSLLSDGETAGMTGEMEDDYYSTTGRSQSPNEVSIAPSRQSLPLENEYKVGEEVAALPQNHNLAEGNEDAYDLAEPEGQEEYDTAPTSLPPTYLFPRYLPRIGKRRTGSTKSLAHSDVWAHFTRGERNARNGQCSLLMYNLPIPSTVSEPAMRSWCTHGRHLR